MYEYNNLLVEKSEGIAVVTVNRPKALNALNSETLRELIDAFGKLDRDDEVQAVILTGAGEKAFVAGADISEMRDLGMVDSRPLILLGETCMNTIEDMEKPVIAAVNGYALGGGNELAMACDIRVASTKAAFGQPEVNLGIIPFFGGTQRLSRLIGKGRAKYYCMTAEFIKADEAYRIGLADRLAEPEALMDECRKIAKTIMSKAPVSIKLCKQAINNGLNTDLKTGIAFEGQCVGLCFATQDQTEGMTAFLEKRQADFKGQ